MQDLRQAMILAVNTSSCGRPTLVIYTPPPGVGKSWQAQKLAEEAGLGDFPIPLRGRRPKGYPEDQWPPKERAIAFATPSHKLADEKAEGHPRVAPRIPAERFRGALHYCKFAKKVEDAYAFVGRRGICGDPGTDQRCEYAIGCPGAEQPKAQRGVVSYVTDAMARHMKFDFAFVDESTGVIEKQRAGEPELRSLFAGALIPRVKRWRLDRNPDAPHAAKLLTDLVTPMAQEHGANVGSGKVAPFSRRLSGEELCRIIDTKTGLWNAIDAGYATDASPPPVPFPAQLRSGAHAGHLMPNVHAFRVMQALRAFYRKTRELDEPPPEQPELPMFQETTKRPDPIVVLDLMPNGSWALELRKVRDLPKCPIVMLDATGELTADEYKAAYPDFNVRVMSLEVYGSQPRRALHVQTPRATRAAMLTAGNPPTQDGVQLVRGLLHSLAAESQRTFPIKPGGPPTTLGVLIYKPYADILNGLTPGPDALRLLSTELAMTGVQLKVGYFGRDDRGTNAFESVHALAVIGDAVPNLGDVETDCLLLGLDTGDVLKARASAIITQAIFRARHTRRSAGDEPILLVAAKSLPRVPGIPWDIVPVPSGRAANAESLAYQMVRFAAADTGCAGLPVLARYDWSVFPVEAPGPPDRRQQVAAVKSFLQSSTWTPYKVGRRGLGRPGSIWAASDEAACAWAASVGLDKVLRTGAGNLMDPPDFENRKSSMIPPSCQRLTKKSQ